MAEYIGTYSGREFEEGQKKDGSKWSKYTLLFKPKDGQQYGFKIPVFMPIRDTSSLTVDKLIEGSMYKVTYSDGAISPKSGKPYKNFQKIEAVTELPSRHDAPTPEKIEQDKEDTIFAESFVAFAQKYKAKTDGNPVQSPLHMMASYLVTYQKDKYRDMYLLCQKTLEKK